MRKLTTLNPIARAAAGRVAAVALACTLAAAGCTTNVNPGSGEPARSGPSAGPVNPSVTPGTSYPTEVPMISSSTATATASAAANRAEFRTKYLGATDPALSSPAVAVVPSQVTSQPPPLLSNVGAINTSLSSEQTSAPVLIGDDPNVVHPPAGTTTGVNASTGGGSGVIGLTQSSAYAPPLGVTSAASSSGLAGSSASMPVINPATVTLTPAVSTASVPSPARGVAVASTTSSSKVLKTTTRRQVVASKRGTAKTTSHPPAAQLATKRVARVHIVQSANGEVIISNEKKP
jgi:hypothetical protein